MRHEAANESTHLLPTSGVNDMPAPEHLLESRRHRLVLDARPETMGMIDPETRLLGLTLLERLVFAARASGFGCIIIQSSDEDILRFEKLLSSIEDIVVTDKSQDPCAQTTVYAPAYLLGERGWLEQCAREEVPANVCRRAGKHIMICAAGTNRSTASAKEISPIRLSEPPFHFFSNEAFAQAERHLLQDLVKETDGFMSRKFARPISLRISRRLAPLGVTPNQATIISMLVGVSASPFFLWSDPQIQIIGGLLFVMHSILDGCDGELARLTWRETRLGGYFDFLTDNVVHIVIFACIAFGWSSEIGATWPLYFGLAAVIGAVGSALAVYWLTMRHYKGSGPVYTSVSSGPSRPLKKLLDDLSRRDFIYLVFILSAFGKASWFLALSAIGAPVYMILVLIIAGHDSLRRVNP